MNTCAAPRAETAWDANLGRFRGERPSRELICRAHDCFDLLWRSGGMKRKRAYDLLAATLGVPREKCHFAMFNRRQCEEVIHQFGELPAILLSHV